MLAHCFLAQLPVCVRWHDVACAQLSLPLRMRSAHWSPRTRHRNSPHHHARLSANIYCRHLPLYTTLVIARTHSPQVAPLRAILGRSHPHTRVEFPMVAAAQTASLCVCLRDGVRRGEMGLTLACGMERARCGRADVRERSPGV